MSNSRANHTIAGESHAYGVCVVGAFSAVTAALAAHMRLFGGELGADVLVAKA